MLKKSFVIVALCASIGVANAAQKNGIIVGVNAGVPITTPVYGGGVESTQK